MKNIKANNRIGRRRITFSLEAKEAEEVILMGDFNNWDPKKHPMKNDGQGMWHKVVMLYPGEYSYKFLVDGLWQKDPSNDQVRLNEYGTHDSVVSIG